MTIGALLTQKTGKFASAAENYKQAARFWEQLANTTPGGSKYRGLAGREYMRAGEALRAAGDFVNAQELMVSYGIKQLRAWAIENDSYEELIRNLIIVANFQRDLGENTKALNTLISAREACNYQKDPLLNAKVWGELAITYNALGQTSNANEALRKQKIEIKRQPQTAKSAIWKLTNTSSNSQDLLKNLQVKAERGARAYQQMQDLEKAASIWQKLANYYDKARLPEQQIVCLRSLATILDLQKKSEESLRVRATAIKTAMKIDKKSLAAEIVQEMIQSFIDANQLENALEGFTELAPIVEQTGNVRGLAKVLEGRGLLLSNNGLHEAAVQDFKSSQKQYLEKVGDPWAAGMVALKLAASQKALNQFESAIETLESALLEIEQKYIRENISPGMDEERSNVIKDIYFSLTSLYVSTGKTEKAENLLRKANVYLWLGELMERLKNDSDPAIHEFAISVNILKPPDSNNNIKILGESRLLADNWADLARACWMIERQNPVSYNALPVNPLEIFKNRFQLPKDSLIIEYLITETSTFIFVCGYDKAVCREVSNQKII